jgi:hypothetical protein
MPDKECPLCGAVMHLRRSETMVQIPGNPGPTARVSTEWMCPDCDYFEEVEEEKG